MILLLSCSICRQVWLAVLLDGWPPAGWTMRVAGGGETNVALEEVLLNDIKVSKNMQKARM